MKGFTDDQWWLRTATTEPKTAELGTPRTPFTLHEFFNTPEANWPMQVGVAAASAGGVSMNPPTPAGLPPPDIPPDTTGYNDYGGTPISTGGGPTVTVGGGPGRGGTVSGIGLTTPPSGIRYPGGGGEPPIRGAIPVDPNTLQEVGEDAGDPRESGTGRTPPSAPTGLRVEGGVEHPGREFNAATGRWETPAERAAYEASHAQNLALMGMVAQHQPTNMAIHNVYRPVTTDQGPTAFPRTPGYRMQRDEEGGFSRVESNARGDLSPIARQMLREWAQLLTTAEGREAVRSGQAQRPTLPTGGG